MFLCLNILGAKKGIISILIYIFLDSNLKVYGASNLTGNKEEIGNMFDGTRDILLPSSLICGISKDIEDRMMSNGNSFSINKQV